MDFSPSHLHRCYRDGSLTPSVVAEHILSRLADPDQASVWISTVDPGRLRRWARDLDNRPWLIDELPLYGLPFNVKDCLDVAGEITTAACPDYAYRASRSSPAVDSVLAAGALYVGKTNLDQFATGLVGLRSPYGAPLNPHNRDYIPGGSSSGTAVSVATGTSSFGLGTDTGGSGRVPASYCGVTGLKPAPGAVSRQGMVAACRSFDTVSVYAATPTDAYRVLDVIAVHDSNDPLAIPGYRVDRLRTPLRWRVAVPTPEQLTFFGNGETRRLFETAVLHMTDTADSVDHADYEPLRRIGDLMFRGPLAAERDVSVGAFLDDHPEAGVPVVRDAILGSRCHTAADAYRARQRVMETRHGLKAFWERHDALLLPTVGTTLTVREVAENPRDRNLDNGYYTNFANPLDLAAITLPFARTAAGVPYGMTLYGPAGSERNLVTLAEDFRREVAQESATPTADATITGD